MSTFGELTEGTLLYLSGFSNMQDQATYLTASVTNSATTVAVADATALSRGLAEIEDELVWLDTVDTTGLTATIPPYGRGYRGTTAVTHASGVRVVSSPLFPRVMVKRAINETLQSLYPTLWGVGTTTFTYVTGTYTYALPAGAKGVLQVQWQDSTTQSEWLAVRRYDIDSNADVTAFPTGASITVMDGIIPGRTVRVVYTKQPSPLVGAADEFTTVTGLPISCEDLVRLGAAHRMVAYLDTPHISGLSAEADFAANQRPVGSGAQLAKFMLQNFQLRVQQEADKLNQLYPARVRYSN